MSKLLTGGDKIAIRCQRLYRTLYRKVRTNRIAIISSAAVVRELFFISIRLGLRLDTERESKEREEKDARGVGPCTKNDTTSFNEFRERERELTRLGINF